ncbi:hypothetical protein LINGRAHAP2_LOCUS32800 [Linum grandiflorum]
MLSTKHSSPNKVGDYYNNQPYYLHNSTKLNIILTSHFGPYPLGIDLRGMGMAKYFTWSRHFPSRCT